MPVVFQGALPNGGPLDKEVSLKKTGFAAEEDDNTSPRMTPLPIQKTASEALEWVSQVLIRTRGKELAGNFNPLLIGELFWEQSSKWPSMSMWTRSQTSAPNFSRITFLKNAQKISTLGFGLLSCKTLKKGTRLLFMS